MGVVGCRLMKARKNINRSETKQQNYDMSTQRWKCLFCKTVTFPKKSLLFQHQKEVHGNSRYACSVCPAKFFCEKKLSKHKCKGQKAANGREDFSNDTNSLNMKIKADLMKASEYAKQKCQQMEIPGPYFYSDSGKSCWKCPHEDCMVTWRIEDQS